MSDHFRANHGNKESTPHQLEWHPWYKALGKGVRYDKGMKLTEQTGANQKVIQLFSVFHDSRRHNERLDPQHGFRGAELAHLLREKYFPSLTDEEFDLLH